MNEVAVVWFIPKIGKDKCDLLSENPALSAKIEFELEAILFVQVIFQLNSDCCTKVEGLHCIILNYEARLGYYKDAISLNSQADQ